MRSSKMPETASVIRKSQIFGERLFDRSPNPDRLACNRFSRAAFLIDLIISEIESPNGLESIDLNLETELVLAYLEKNKAVFLSYEGSENHIPLEYISGLIILYERYDHFNSISPVPLKLDWFSRLSSVQDIDQVARILPSIDECVTDIEFSENYDVDDYGCPIGLYASMLGDFSRNSLYWDSSYGIEYLANPDRMEEARTYYDLWRSMDINTHIKFLNWDTSIRLRLPNFKLESNLTKEHIGTFAPENECKKYLRQRGILCDLLQQLDSYPVSDSNQNDISIIRNRIKALDLILEYLIWRTEINLAVRDEMIKLDERNRILSNLSHSIKNMLRSVIDPLINLREEMPQKAIIIDNAIKGANLIREIVNAINLSFEMTLEELQWDVQNPGKEYITLQDIVLDSLKYSVSNMFDFRYFPSYAENYFPRSLYKQDFDWIKDQWRQVSANKSIDTTVDFINSYLFQLDLRIDGAIECRVGNVKSSAIKLMVLFQEIIFNAVKYTSFVPFAERKIVIALENLGNKLRFTVKNTYSPDVQAKTTGIGKLIIENFAKVLGCFPVVEETEDSYSISLEFENLWYRERVDA